MAKKTHDDQVCLNSHVLDALREHGDALTAVREIDHFAYFSNAELCIQFIDKCLAVGFKLRTTGPAATDDSFLAQVFHNDVPDEETLGKITSLLVDLAQEYGGEYDGWETQVVK
jgi:hypothetical protein